MRLGRGRDSTGTSRVTPDMQQEEPSAMALLISLSSQSCLIQPPRPWITGLGKSRGRAVRMASRERPPPPLLSWGDILLAYLSEVKIP